VGEGVFFKGDLLEGDYGTSILFARTALLTLNMAWI